jgi:hypothetical protein
MKKSTTNSQSSKSSYLSMMFLAILAFVLGFAVTLDGMLVYNLPFFTSISESATTGPMTGMIMPFVLGGMFVYFVGYRGYDKIDRICAKIMGLGAFGVAMQLCYSDYLVNFKKVGLFGLSPNTSNIVHSVAAILLFATMIYWVGCRFTKGVGDDNITHMKKRRNKIYKTCALASLAGVVFFIVGPILGIKASVFISELLILLPLSLAIFTKAGGWLKDMEGK